MIFGVGIDDIKLTPEERRTQLFIAWQGMFRRCYDPKFHLTNPTYAGCSVDPRWHYYSVFYAWAIQQDYAGKQLDKDLLVKNNRVYGPDTCLFISKELNTLMGSTGGTGNNLIGVTQRKFNRWHAKIKIKTKMVHLGYFGSPEEASEAYKKAKLELIKKPANECTCLKTRTALLAIEL